MAVYTDVSAEELADFLAGYDLGELLSYKGIAEGVENSNFLVHTTAGYFILTLYEKRVAPEDLPFFLGADGAPRGARAHLPAAGQEPERRHARQGRRPAGRDRHLPRRHVDPAPERQPLRGARRGAGASCISPGADFPMRRRNALSVDGWRPLYRSLGRGRRQRCSRDLRDTIEKELTLLEGALAERPAARA